MMVSWTQRVVMEMSRDRLRCILKIKSQEDFYVLDVRFERGKKESQGSLQCLWPGRLKQWYCCLWKW